VPIVFAGVADPVGAGYVESLARPGGNATGFMLFETA
jgi:putative ABC transport system substrate-binding protein